MRHIIKMRHIKNITYIYKLTAKNRYRNLVRALIGVDWVSANDKG